MSGERRSAAQIRADHNVAARRPSAGDAFARSRSRRVEQRRAGSLRSPPLVVRLHEVTGESRRSWDAAVRDAIARGRRDVKDVVSVEVVRLGGTVSGGRVRTYRAAVRLAYRGRVAGPS